MYALMSFETQAICSTENLLSAKNPVHLCFETNLGYLSPTDYEQATMEEVAVA
jgi:hypothetical protein